MNNNVDFNMGKSKSTAMPPIPIKRALNKLGRDIRDARRRRIPMAIMAERASISRTTLNKVRAIAENGGDGA